MKIAAFDLSLASTGYAILEKSLNMKFGTLAPNKANKGAKLEGMPRLDWICNQSINLITNAELVIFEDLAFAAHDRNHERAGLATLIRYHLWKLKIPYVLVAPTSLKKFCTGSGRGDKNMMCLAVFKSWNHDPKNDNEADAIGLAYVGAMLAGDVVPKTKAQEEVLKTIKKGNAVALKQVGIL